MSERTKRRAYLMVVDADDGSGIEFGVDWGLDEGEELPEDIEDLSRAQYTVWQIVRALKGIGDEAFAEETQRMSKERPTGIMMPSGGEG